MTASTLAVSAATVVEGSMVVESRQGREAADDLQALLADLECEVIPVDENLALGDFAQTDVLLPPAVNTA